MKNLLVFTMFIFLSCGLKDAKEYPLPTTIEFPVDKTIKVEEETEDFILTVTEKQFVASVSIGDTVVFTVSERTLIPVLGEIYEKTFATRKKEFFCHQDGDWVKVRDGRCHPLDKVASCTLKFRDVEEWRNERLMFFRYDYENHLLIEIGDRLYPIEKGNHIEYVENDVVFRFEITKEMVEEDNRLYLVPTPKKVSTVTAGFVEFGNCPDQTSFGFSEDLLSQQEYREKREYLVGVTIKRGQNNVE